MVVLGALVFIIVVGVVFGPQIWVKHVMKKHAVDRPDFPGTGGELARHLLDEVKLGHVGVEATDGGDHYDPTARVVRLSRDNFNGRSVTAVAVAAHEVGHAVQHANEDPSFMRRLAMIGNLAWVERVAMGVLVLAPFVFAVFHSPALVVINLLAGLAILGIGVVVHVLTLPVEFDASFGKALPVLEQGGYLQEQDIPAARSVLRAAAYTYVAAALVTLLNIFRWLRR
ncbi:MAG TPA: zinc metallopeptidase [Pseudolabrys sp.]|nr:zinc metallopeptidase [Pseudolabrys sp.]